MNFLSEYAMGVRRKALMAAFGLVAAVAGCGGPETVTPPPPPQTVNAYWIGIEGVGDTHLHITFTQTGTALGLQPNCFIDRCSFLPFTQAGAGFIGSEFPVEIRSVSGTFNNPNITFTFTLVNDRTFSFTGVVAENRLMQGQISGATLPASVITLEKQP